MAGQSKKQSTYDKLRMEGREMNADLMSAIKGLGRNVRFMSSLPPIQQLIKVESEEETNTWRERLATIFRGLLQANPNYQTVVYSRIDGESFSELVRVERHGQDSSTIRSVPRSRLRSDDSSDHLKAILAQKPDDVLAALACDPMCERQTGCDSVGLVVGGPVFDETTEEVFGVVMINYDIDQKLRTQLSRRSTATEIIVACDIFGILMHSKDGQIIEGTTAHDVVEESPLFESAVQTLKSRLEFIDDTNMDIYGVRLWFIPNKLGIKYLLRQKSD